MSKTISLWSSSRRYERYLLDMLTCVLSHLLIMGVLTSAANAVSDYKECENITSCIVLAFMQPMTVLTECLLTPDSRW